MGARNSRRGWGWVARTLHWTIATLILFMLGLGIYMSNFVPDLLKQFPLVQLHKSWGAVVFAAVILRLVGRLANPAPQDPPAMPRWQARTARISHALLYLLMLALPLSGWVMVSSSPTQDLLHMQNTVFGLFALPDPWVPGVASLSDRAQIAHVALAVLLVAVLAVHVAAALKHHFIDRDEVLDRMLRDRTGG